MKELFPIKHVMGFVFSLILTSVALLVYILDMSFALGLTILLITAFAQAALQLVVFMHAGESEDKGAIYTSVYYGIIIAVLTVFGTLLAMIWGYV
ncbi:MAG: cytochrome aa3 quinol oxidase subunit IV [Bacillota bacterium]|uniref:Quinol oxidase subunit 4 n=1 Tax=Virgibacillus salarius TaxID=447199 RepID=A0A941DSS3_9BACI|nr:MULTISPECIES: cytochrome aa3 quinol oxidase subunit IV [Bacillaceae]NAZ07431.1 cytochrome aa3 quinol oxidase subunit IV [Agaribacter marinus]MBR7794711.1 cytochrome aa3 quinol oxidase subunit IV [Virgibacillus salarius]MCC2249565.1 cytochrome aa3 quinol oxidase subunit IV [Virgibacillus sp. AGTR]MDY7044509.1 cytochrome aa3 quinol oxidase subunit IV [Virgibacillus sp. M23]QRZ19354.1 cytochrome aa3 quinol oxidase subunit IV [Virgibacillus sp. AGTR]